MTSDPCQPIIDEIEALNQQETALEDQLSLAAPTQKAELRKEIKAVQKKAGQKEKELANCRKLNPESPLVLSDPDVLWEIRVGQCLAQLLSDPAAEAKIKSQIKSAVTGFSDPTLNTYFKDAYPNMVCVDKIEQGALWHRAIGPPELLNALPVPAVYNMPKTAAFAFLFTASFLEGVVKAEWDALMSQPNKGRYSTDGNPDPNGQIELKSYDLQHDSPTKDKIVFTVKGTYHGPVDVDFTVTYTDTIWVDDVKISRNPKDMTTTKQVLCSHSSNIDAPPPGVLDGAEQLLLMTLPFAPFTVPIGSILAQQKFDQLYGGLQAPEEPGLACSIARNLLKKILVAKSDPNNPEEHASKWVFDYNQTQPVTIDGVGFLASGSLFEYTRWPSVFLTGLSEILLPAKGPYARYVTYGFGILADDLRRDDNDQLQTAWSSSGQIKIPQGVVLGKAEFVNVTFDVHTQQDQSISVKVTDADGLTASASLQLPINFRDPTPPKTVLPPQE